MRLRCLSLLKSLGVVAAAAALLAACQDSQVPKQFKPVPSILSEKMKKMDMSETGPVFIRIFKESSELEVWKQKRNGKYALLKIYEICKWSGELGPKIAEGDRQAPEGFYTVTPAQMNPKSSYYLSFDIGFPNAFDRAHERTGSHLMVHGACSSAGCYSMTDESAGELFALARDSFRGGQRAFQIQALPFRMTPENFAKHRDNKHYEFWQMLKTGYDHFELTRTPPKVDVCGKRYVFDADSGDRKFSPTGACPNYSVPEGLKVAVAQKQAVDEEATAVIVARLTQEAQEAAEDQRRAEEKRVAAEAKAAEREASRQSRVELTQEKLGIFGRLFGRGDKAAASTVVADTTPAATETSDTPVTAFAPATPPMPPRKPATQPAQTLAPASAGLVASAPAPAGSPAPTAAAASPTEAPVVQAQDQSEITPEIPTVGRFVKKDFLWVDDDS